VTMETVTKATAMTRTTSSMLASQLLLINIVLLLLNVVLRAILSRLTP
jgi:hypothetical protein